MALVRGGLSAPPWRPGLTFSLDASAGWALGSGGRGQPVRGHDAELPVAAVELL